MLSRLTSFMRSGVIALAALATVPASAPAAPLGPSIMPAVADSTLNPTLVQDGGYRGNGRSGGPGYWPRAGRGWNGGGNWGGRGGNWNGGRNWNGNWRGHGRHYRRGYYGHGHNYYGNSGIYLGLGLGALGYGLGYGSGYYNDPYYRPRRVYRGVASTHEEWCYNRYRSYRDWDNTFQPYHGPRRQCHSPFG